MYKNIFLVVFFTALPAVTAAAQSGGDAPTTPVQASSYRVNPGDQLEVFVWGEERLQREVRVLPDGTFSFPLVGTVTAAGRAPAEIERIISQGLEGQYRGAVPEVTVAVANPSGLQFSVVGRVRTPGTFTPGRYVNVLEALSFAGGPTEFARLGSVIIIRKEAGGLISIRVRLADLLRGEPGTDGALATALPQLQGGDTVVVP